MGEEEEAGTDKYAGPIRENTEVAQAPHQHSIRNRKGGPFQGGREFVPERRRSWHRLCIIGGRLSNLRPETIENSSGALPRTAGRRFLTRQYRVKVMEVS